MAIVKTLSPAEPFSATSRLSRIASGERSGPVGASRLTRASKGLCFVPHSLRLAIPLVRVCSVVCPAPRLTAAMSAKVREANSFSLREVTVHLFAPPIHRHFSLAFVFLLLITVPRGTVASPSAHQRDSIPDVPGLQPIADSGDSIAQFKLAYSLLFDPHTQHPNPDYATGLRLLRSSASQHFAPAQFFLGYAYEHGQGVPVDYAQAAENYRASALQGYAAAENNLCALYYHGFGVPKDLTLAFEYCRSAALHDSPVGQYHLGSFYYFGYGTAPDVAKAVEWYRASAEHGFAAAQLNLANFYSEGTGVPIDFTEAAHWAKLAAEQGVSQAASKYAYLCENGIGVPRDYVAAYLWYSRAVAEGDKFAAARVKAVAHHLSRSERDQAKSMLATEATRPQQPSSGGAISDQSLTASP